MSRYRQIAAEFGYSERADREAAALLDASIACPLPLVQVRRIVQGRTVLVAGAGPSLHRHARALRRFGVPRGAALVSADSATGTLLEAARVVPDVVVTDLDGNRANALQRAAGAGAAMVVHAHGDNAGLLEGAAASLGPRCLGTSQCRPFGSLHNFGGFTDGDRAAFLADSLGAARIVLCGMDLCGGRIGSASATPASGRPVKLRKLEWAGRLLEWLAGTSRSRLLTASPCRMRGFEEVGIADVLRGRVGEAGREDGEKREEGGATRSPRRQ